MNTEAQEVVSHECPCMNVGLVQSFPGTCTFMEAVYTLYVFSEVVKLNIALISNSIKACDAMVHTGLN